MTDLLDMQVKEKVLWQYVEKRKEMM
jgi:hypothetical protein